MIKLKFENVMFFMTIYIYKSIIDDIDDNFTLLHLFLFIMPAFTLLIDLLILPFTFLASIKIYKIDNKKKEKKYNEDYFY